MNKIAIIGGGAAGLMAAITAANEGADVLVFEQNDAPGKKILASGNGRCNIINDKSSIDDFEGLDTRFASHALNVMDYNTFERFCKSIGLLLERKEDGKCYPLSQEAKAVQSALVRAAVHAGVRFQNNTYIEEVLREGDGFAIRSDAQTARFDRLVIATGSPAAPQLGGNASGIAFARALGHAVSEPFPSLVGLHLDAPELAKMTGVKTLAHVTLLVDNTPVSETLGDILFTRYGISGFAVLDLSHRASEALRDFSQVSLHIDLLPQFTLQSLAAQIEQMSAAIPDDTLYDLLCGLVPHKLITSLLRQQKLPIQTPCREVNAKTAKKAAYALKQWHFAVTDTHGFKHAEVAGGGVLTREIDPKTMESLLVRHLFFAGEVIDITGHRGGFNFHFAWGSGYLAGRHAARA